MSKIFNPVVLDKLQQQISRSLEDTFNVMFSFELSVCESVNESNQQGAMKAYIELKNGSSTAALLTLTIPRHIVDHLTRTLSPDGAGASDLGQDVTCEITNVVGHALRSCFLDMPEVTFNVGLPQVGSPKVLPLDAGYLRLHFLAKSQDTVDLDFVYSQSA